MRIKTTPTKSRNRTPVKSVNYGAGLGNQSVMSGGGYSNKPTNVFSNAPSTFDPDQHVGRMAYDDYIDLPPPTFTPTKTATNDGTLHHFYDEILTIEQLLDLKTFNLPSYPPSAMASPRPASGFVSLNATPTKGTYTKAQSVMLDFGPYLTKRAVDKVEFSDVEEGLRKKLIGWDQIEFKREVFDHLANSYKNL
jgi:hypothetical protein